MRSFAADVLAAWALAASFAAPLQLAPFTPAELAAAVERLGESVLLAELHVRLLSGLLREDKVQGRLWE